jgi:hypothetical protein
MQRITWKHKCYFCNCPVDRGKPLILFSTDKPGVVGVCHLTCGITKYNYVYFQMCPPEHLSDEQVTFLMHLLVKLYSLPGGEEPNRELRICLASLLDEYPSSIGNPAVSLQKFLREYKRWFREMSYSGDLEADFLCTIGQIQKAANNEPLRIEIDFQKV